MEIKSTNTTVYNKPVNQKSASDGKQTQQVTTGENEKISTSPGKQEISTEDKFEKTGESNDSEGEKQFFNNLSKLRTMSGRKVDKSETEEVKETEREKQEVNTKEFIRTALSLPKEALKKVKSAIDRLNSLGDKLMKRLGKEQEPFDFASAMFKASKEVPEDRNKQWDNIYRLTNQQATEQGSAFNSNYNMTQTGSTTFQSTDSLTADYSGQMIAPSGNQAIEQGSAFNSNYNMTQTGSTISQSSDSLTADYSGQMIAGPGDQATEQGTAQQDSEVSKPEADNKPGEGSDSSTTTAQATEQGSAFNTNYNMTQTSSTTSQSTESLTADYSGQMIAQSGNQATEQGSAFNTNYNMTQTSSTTSQSTGSLTADHSQQQPGQATSKTGSN